MENKIIFITPSYINDNRVGTAKNTEFARKFFKNHDYTKPCFYKRFENNGDVSFSLDAYAGAFPVYFHDFKEVNENTIHFLKLL